MFSTACIICVYFSPFLDGRLQDVVHSEKRIYLVFEYLDLDLKKHMDSCPELAKDPRLVKVHSILVSRTCFIFVLGHYVKYAKNAFAILCV